MRFLLVIFLILFYHFGIPYIKTEAKKIVSETFSDQLSYDDVSFSLPFVVTFKEVCFKNEEIQFNCPKVTLKLSILKSLQDFGPWVDLNIDHLQFHEKNISLQAHAFLTKDWKGKFDIFEKSGEIHLDVYGKTTHKETRGTVSGTGSLVGLPIFFRDFSLLSDFKWQNESFTLSSFFVKHALFFFEGSGFKDIENQFFSGKIVSTDLSFFPPFKGSFEGYVYFENKDFLFEIFSPSLFAFGQEWQEISILGNLLNGKNGYISLENLKPYPFQLASRIFVENGQVTLPDIKILGEGTSAFGSAFFSDTDSLLNLSGNMQHIFEEAVFDIHLGHDTLFSLKAKKLFWGDRFLLNSYLEGQCEKDIYRVTYLETEFEHIPIFLDGEALFRMDDKKITFEKATFHIEENGRFSYSGWYEDEKFSLELFGKNLPLKPSKGDLSFFFDLHLHGPLHSPLGTGAFFAKGILKEEEKEIPVLIDLETNLRENQLEIQGRGHFFSPLVFSFELPSHLSFSPFSFTIDKKGPIKGSFDLKADLASFGEVFDFGGVLLEGGISTHMKISGSLLEPEVSGNLLFTEAHFEDEVSGFSFSHLNGEIRAEKNRLFINSLSGFVGNEGTIRGEGELLLSTLKNFPYKMNLYLHQTDVFSTDSFHNLLSGNLTLEGDRQALQLHGELTASVMEVNIPEESQEDLDTVEITYEDDLHQENEIEELLSMPPFSFSYEIKVLIPKTLVIKDKKLFSRWKGDLLLVGGRKESGLFGDLKVVEGEYLINGKRFEIRQGSVALRGDLERKTSLYVTADFELPKLTAHVTVKGPLQKPVLSFRSTPPKSQREILSYVLFGKGVSDISATEGEELSESLIQINQDGNKGPDMLTQIQNRIGIDQIDISRDNETESAVSLRIGKYLSRGVFVWLNRGINDNSNRVAIEARLIRNFLLQAEIGDGENSDNEISLKWKIDY